MEEFKAYGALRPNGPLEPFSFDPGELGPEEVEIKVSHCGLCHSDLSMLDNEWGMSQYPFVPGHEVTGTVVALGEAAKGLKIGQRVGLGWFSHSCLACHQCLSARQLGAHYVHNTRQDGALKKLAGRLDLIISTINANQDVSAFLETLAPKGCFHNVGAVLQPLAVPAFSLIAGQKSIADSPTGSP